MLSRSRVARHPSTRKHLSLMGHCRLEQTSTIKSQLAPQDSITPGSVYSIWVMTVNFESPHLLAGLMPSGGGDRGTDSSTSRWVNRLRLLHRTCSTGAPGLHWARSKKRRSIAESQSRPEALRCGRCRGHCPVLGGDAYFTAHDRSW